MNKSSRIKTHPGEVLKEEFMAPLNLSANALAKAINAPHHHQTRLRHHRRSTQRLRARQSGR